MDTEDFNFTEICQTRNQTSESKDRAFSNASNVKNNFVAKLNLEHMKTQTMLMTKNRDRRISSASNVIIVLEAKLS